MTSAPKQEIHQLVEKIKVVWEKYRTKNQRDTAPQDVKAQAVENLKADCLTLVNLLEKAKGDGNFEMRVNSFARCFEKLMMSATEVEKFERDCYEDFARIERIPDNF